MMTTEDEINQFGCLRCPTPWRQPWPTREQDLHDLQSLFGYRLPRIPRPAGVRGVDEIITAYFVGKYGEVQGEEIAEKAWRFFYTDLWEDRIAAARARDAAEGKGLPLMRARPKSG